MAKPPRNPLLKVKKATELRPFYLIAGDEPFLVQDALDQIRNLFLANDEGTHEWECFEENLIPQLDQKLDEIFSPGMFSTHRVIHLVVSHKFFKNQTKFFQQHAEQPLAQQIVVIEISNYDRRERNTLQLKFVSSVLEPQLSVINACRLFESPPPWKRQAEPWDTELCHWIRERGRVLHGLNLSPKHLLDLVNLCGNDPGRLAGELDKLSLHFTPGQKISDDILQAITLSNREGSLEDLTTALQALDPSQILQTLHRCQNSGLHLKGRHLLRAEEQNPILFKTLQNYLRHLILTHRFLSRHPNATLKEKKLLADDLGLHKIRNPDLLQKTLDQWIKTARRVRLETLWEWQKCLHESRRDSRQGAPAAYVVFNLITQMFHRLLISQSPSHFSAK